MPCIQNKFQTRRNNKDHLSLPGFVHTVTKILYVFPEKELRGLCPNFHIRMPVSDLYIPKISPHIFLQQNRQTHRLKTLYKSQTHECGNWDWSRAISFLGIFVANFRYCVFAAHVTYWNSRDFVSRQEYIFFQGKLEACAEEGDFLPLGMNMMTKVMLVQAIRPQALHTSCNTKVNKP